MGPTLWLPGALFPGVKRVGCEADNSVLMPVLISGAIPTFLHTRAVRKVSSHLEYLENRSRGLDVTWQPVREDLTVHP
jgi:hypothetical protein